MRRWAQTACALLLGTLIGLAGPARAGARAQGAPVLPPLEVRLLNLESPVLLLVAHAGETLRVAVRAVQLDPLCGPGRRLDWARRVLRPGMPLQLGMPDRSGGRTVRFAWEGQTIDWGLLLLRAGQVLPGGGADDTTRLPPAYAWAVREARAEGRGLWGECGHPLGRFHAPGLRQGIPADVLYGIAMVESGIAGRPWPWTLNVAGRPLRFRTRQEAWIALKRLAAAGISRVDVGLMQVNWHYHGHRFRSPWEALDPDINIGVAAAILAELWRDCGGLPGAIARYHSGDPVAGEAYARRVIQWAGRLRSDPARAPPARDG